MLKRLDNLGIKIIILTNNGACQVPTNKEIDNPNDKDFFIVNIYFQNLIQALTNHLSSQPHIICSYFNKDMPGHKGYSLSKDKYFSKCQKTPQKTSQAIQQTINNNFNDYLASYNSQTQRIQGGNYRKRRINKRKTRKHKK